MAEYSLKESERKMIAVLDGQSRMSINQLAKKLKVSKDGANYRLKKLFSEQIITRCFAEINVSKLGLIIGKVTLQFQNLDENKSDEIFDYLKNLPRVPWVVYCSGRWDCIFGLFVKDIYETQEILNNLSEKYGKYILSKEVLIEPEYFVVSRGWATDNAKRTVTKVGGKVEYVVDELDTKIIKTLTENCRTPILDMAIKLNQSSNTIINRIKNLEKKEVIQNYFIGLNLEKIGMEFCKAFVYLQNPAKEEYKSLVDYCLNHPNVIAVSNTVGAWEMEIEMEVQNFDAFYRVMNDIKTKFKHVIRSYEAVTITREHGRDYSKFL
ncbi:MAG: Lrp/AsnC family transcriptional regulator [Nanoarchaeota archaeon]|nr:Lrp/AsnC family transcriptional regulator [Nanoarchaeota archaeon]MBU1103965.1 Lrp/AsnC family transcriptional regulator [Nanoarchaeota archaeon]